jgi:glycosyltransferase involved in cell wall biosynthesis
MKILHLATSLNGGAGVAARRMNIALNSIGVDSQILGRNSSSSRNSDLEIELKLNEFQKVFSSAVTVVQSTLIQKSEDLVTSLSMSTVSPDHPLVMEADILHIHSFYNLFSWGQLKKFSELGKPIFITLHDQRLFTGGCHYARGCDGFLTNCKNCPQTRYLFKGLPQLIHHQQEKTLGAMSNLQLITPSSWLKSEALKSSLFQGHSVEVLHNPIPDLFCEFNNQQARKSLGVSNSEKVISFVSENLNNPYKDIQTFVCLANSIVKTFGPESFLFLAVGKGEIQGFNEEVSWRQLRPANEVEMAETMSAIDVLVVPSTADNSPSVVGEALFAGASVVGSDTGGIPELIENKKERIFEVGDVTRAMKVTLEALSHHDRDANALLAHSRFSSKIIARKLTLLYEKSLNDL